MKKKGWHWVFSCSSFLHCTRIKVKDQLPKMCAGGICVCVRMRTFIFFCLDFRKWKKSHTQKFGSHVFVTIFFLEPWYNKVCLCSQDFFSHWSWDPNFFSLFRKCPNYLYLHLMCLLPVVVLCCCIVWIPPTNFEISKKKNFLI